MGRSTARVIMTVAGIAILVGFFMPWFDFQDIQDGSGFEILRKGDLSSLWLAVLLVVPAGGLLLGAAGVSGVRFARYLSLLVGAVILGYGSYRFFQIFFASTGPGVWLVITGGLIALIVGLMPERIPTSEPTPPARAGSTLTKSRPKPPPVPKGGEETKELTPPLG